MNVNVLLTGSVGVGKTSIYNRIVNDQFDLKYYATIGCKKGQTEIPLKANPVPLILSDCQGEVSQNKVPDITFYGQNLILYVVDLTRPSSFKNIKKDLDFFKQKYPGIKVKILLNKSDLFQPEQLMCTIQQLADIEFHGVVSAKTGNNIMKLLENFLLELLYENDYTHHARVVA